jgi:excisionase family DNA binding protein
VEEWLTIKDVAARLKVHTKTVRRLVELGHLAPPRKVAGTILRWTARDVETYLYRLDRREFEKPG